MIRKKYIITAHDHPAHLLRLINVLNDDRSEFLVHIDLKYELKDFTDLIKLDNVRFIENRVDCIWGDFSQVEATINLMNEAVTGDINSNDRIIFLSGIDYPIKKIEYLDDFFINNIDVDFIDYNFDERQVPINSDLYSVRILKYKLNFSSKRGDFFLTKGFLKESLFGKIYLLKMLFKKKITYSFFKGSFGGRKSIFNNHYYGSNWFCLTNKTALKIINYIDNNKRKLYSYYKYTLCADEQFFHTILKEIQKTDSTIKIKPNLHFVDWNRKNVSLPVTFTIKDLELLLSQPQYKFFAGNLIPRLILKF